MSMMSLSERAKRINPSATLTISAKAKAMRAKGIPVLNFSAGEPDFDTPEAIKGAASKALAEGFTKYTAAAGIPELKEAIVAKYEKEIGVTYDSSEVIVSNGGKHALHNIFQALLNPGDEVLIPSPYWLSYPEMVKLSGGVPVVVETRREEGFKLDLEELRRAITQKTKILIVNSPSNPTGAVYRSDELRGIAELVEQNEFMVVSDDVYEKFIFDGLRFANLVSVAPHLKDRVVIINSVSKTYAMPGWRIGFALGAETWISAAVKIQGQATSCPNSIAQKAAAFALSSDQTVVSRFCKSFQRRRDIMLEGLKNIRGFDPFKPVGAFYLFVDVSRLYSRIEGVSDSVSFCEYLLDKFHIACVPGSVFGEDRCIRFSFAAEEAAIKEATERLRKKGFI
jgi:aspartate aminotransferase